MAINRPLDLAELTSLVERAAARALIMPRLLVQQHTTIVLGTVARYEALVNEIGASKGSSENVAIEIEQVYMPRCQCDMIL